MALHGAHPHVQTLHVHPRQAPDGSYVLFFSNMGGYGQLCTAALNDFDALPVWDEPEDR